VPAVETPWWQLLRYVVSRDPGLMSRVAGASPYDIERLSACCPHPVPTGVLELWSTIGQRSDDFWPLDRITNINVPTMLDDTEYQCIDDRFFRVATIFDEQELGYGDLYVDLKYSNGYDAPLIEIWGEWDRREPHAGCHTLMSKAIRWTFHAYDIARRGEYGSLGHGMVVDELPIYAETFRALTTRMGLPPVFCEREDLQCYASDTLALMFDAIGPGVPLGVLPGESPPTRCYLNIWIGTTDFDALRNVAAQIRDAMPPLPFFTRWLPTGSVDADHPE
jgi:hypothetical protein